MRCFTKNGTRVEILNDSDCTEPKPEDKKPCNLRPCEGVDWIASDWSGVSFHFEFHFDNDQDFHFIHCCFPFSYCTGL